MLLRAMRTPAAVATYAASLFPLRRATAAATPAKITYIFHFQQCATSP